MVGLPRSSANLPLAKYHVLLGGKPFQAHRAPGVQLVGGDTDFGTQAVLETVGKAGGSIDHHRGGVHLAQKPHGAPVIAGDNAVGVQRAVSVDVLDSLILVAPLFYLYLQITEKIS